MSAGVLSTTLVRPATLADVPALVALGERFRSESPYRDQIAANPAQMAAIATRLIAGEGAVFVSTVDETLTGMIAVFGYAHPISGESIAAELCWWVTPDHRGHGIRLLRRAEMWARTQGAIALQMIAPAGADDVAAIYTRLGYDAVETAYQRRL